MYVHRYGFGQSDARFERAHFWHSDAQIRHNNIFTCKLMEIDQDL